VAALTQRRNLGRSRTSRSSSSSAELATSSKRPFTHAVTISARRPDRGDHGRDEHVGVKNDAHVTLSTLDAPLAAHRVQLLVGKFERLVGVQGLTGLTGLLIEHGGDAVAATGQLQVAFVGEHDRPDLAGVPTQAVAMR
jgi:hypothetical protein